MGNKHLNIPVLLFFSYFAKNIFMFYSIILKHFVTLQR